MLSRSQVVGIVLLTVTLLIPVAGRAAQDATPAATGELRIGERQAVDLGGRRLLGLSPDGRRLAGYDGNLLCVHDAATLAEERCVEVPRGMIHWDVAAWSPDGARFAFTEHAAVTFVDSDLWVLEVATGELANLTDDGYEGSLPLFEENAPPDPVHVDILPAWAPDGRSLAFVRSTVRDDDWRGTSILRIGLDGGEPEEIVRVSDDVPLAVYLGMRWAPDGERLLYTVAHPDPDEPDNGVWIVDADGENARHLAGTTDPERAYRMVVEVAASGDRALVFYPIPASRFPSDLGPLYAILDLESGDLAPLEIPDRRDDTPDAVETPRVATFSPDGARVLYALTDREPPDQVVLIEPGGTHRRLADDVVTVALSFGRGLVWAANGTVFAPAGITTGILLRLAGEGATAPAPPPDATPASPAATTPGPDTGAGLEVGATAVVNDANVALRGAPSTEAPIVAELAHGTEVIVIGPAEEGGGFVWVPVRDEATRAIGYVRREFLSPAPDS